MDHLSDVKSIDCDVHPSVPGMPALLPYLEDFWRDSVEERGITSLESISYPPNAPISVRCDFRVPPANRPPNSLPLPRERRSAGRAVEGGEGVATTVGELRAQVFDRWGMSLAICNCLYGVQLVLNEDMARAFARALNEWMATEWLDREERLRASIVVPLHNVEFAVDEIERWAGDPRFVQVLVLAMGEVPLGRRQFWPIYAAAERHGRPIGIHAGSAYRHPVTSLGWPTYYVEDYAAQTQGFQSQVASLICEGVLSKHPALKVVLIESGVTWVPAFLWRMSKFWRGLRTEIPWIDRSPSEIFRDHFRLTVQPFDAPDSPDIVHRVIEHLGSDELLLFSSDYPHWQFDGDHFLPAGIPADLARKIMVDNPLATYFGQRNSLSPS
jgi:predicted TIM-barrel fold metal-dependent hydrolase